MSDLAKPISTIELASSAVALIKTAAVVVVMMVLEWAKIRERRAQIETAVAKSDAAVANLKTEATTDARTDAAVIDDFLRARGLDGAGPGGSPPSA